MQAVIIVLGRQSLPLAEQIQAALPGALRYGLASRIEATEVEVSFTEFGDTVRRLFTEGRPIIGICAAGILIRTLAPLLSDKRQEPPVLAVAEDGSAVVPLLGGLQGVNDLARQIGLALSISPAITTTGDLRFRTALLAPPRGYELANPDDAKIFIANLLAGATVQLQGEAAWLSQSQLPLAPEADLILQVTERAVQPHANCLVYHPKTLAIGLDGASLDPADPEAAVILINQTLSAANLARAAVVGVFATTAAAGHPSIHAVAQSLKVPARFFPDASLDPARIALQATAGRGQLVVTHPVAIARAQLPFEAEAIGQAQGRLAIVGTGPGRADWMSPEVKALLKASTDWVGYTTYLNLVEPLRQGQQRHDSDNRVELDRARLALDLAAQGRSVALISSGDPGVYAMATAVFEVLEAEAANKLDWQQLEIRVAPGISALQAAASRIGAPIGHDFCAISLSV
jgi:cobalt-precorrin 5A hydrolase / precorrin-3B C17-methyltransferase